MRLIRRFVYWLGYRPRFGSVLYSPTLDLRYACKDIAQNFLEGIEETHKEMDRHQKGG